MSTISAAQTQLPTGTWNIDPVHSHVGSVRALFEERYTDEELETLASLLGRLPQ